MSQERRRFSRIVYPIDATLSQGEQQWETCVLDISLSGALVDTPADWDSTASGGSSGNSDSAGNQYHLAFHLPRSKEMIEMDVRLAHQTDDYLGLERTTSDLDSISHLKRLIALNLGEEALLHRELSQLLRGGDGDEPDYSASVSPAHEESSADDAEPNDMLKP